MDGRRLGDFEIIREIDRGGMGIVYEARQLSLDRHVALKVLPAEMTADPLSLQRFEREAKALAALNQSTLEGSLKSRLGNASTPLTFAPDQSFGSVRQASDNI